MELNNKIKNDRGLTFPLTTNVTDEMGEKFKRLAAANCHTPAQALREMVASYCEDLP